MEGKKQLKFITPTPLSISITSVCNLQAFFFSSSSFFVVSDALFLPKISCGSSVYMNLKNKVVFTIPLHVCNFLPAPI